MGSNYVRIQHLEDSIRYVQPVLVVGNLVGHRCILGTSTLGFRLANRDRLLGNSFEQLSTIH